MFLDWWTPIENLPALLKGALVSLELTLTVFALSLFFGTIVGFLRYNKHHKAGYRIATVYVELIRNTPMLVQIFFLYFGLPQFKIYLPALFAGILGLTINNTAYIAEIVRSGIQSIPKGQWEAANCLGLKPIHTFLDVIFPQALRNIFPSLINQFIMILFGTSLLSVIDIKDLTQVASILNSQNFRTLELFTFAIGIYYIMSVICSKILRYVNNRFFPSISNGGR